MKAVVFITPAAAEAAERILRKADGIRNDGSDAELTLIGGGGHLPNEMCRTQRFALVVKHPTLDRWAVLLRDRDVGRFASAKAEAALVGDRLTRAEYDTLKTRLTAAADLSDDWIPAGVMPRSGAKIEPRDPR